MKRPLVPEESFGAKDLERGSREPPARETESEPPVAALDPAVERLRRTQQTYGNRASQRMIMQARAAQRDSPENEVTEEELAPGGGGQPLDKTEQTALEAHFGADLAHVRVHTDSRAARGADAIDAQAYTAGRDIYFAPGMYSPSTNSGRRLLAHEVAHVVQQSSGKESTIATKAAAGAKIGAPDDSLEEEAEQQAGQFMSGTPTDEEQRKRRESSGGVQRSIQRKAAPTIQRQPKTAAEIAGEELARGPQQQRGDKAAWEQADKRAAEEAQKGDMAPIIQVSLSKTHAAVREVSSAEFEKEFKACPTAHQESGLPEAFLCAESSISPWVTRMEDDPKPADVRVQTKPGARSGGEVWVSSANLGWSLKTAGFLDTARIDASMLGPYRNHEVGHREIEDGIASRLAILAEADLRRSLPQEKTPLKESGGNWVQKGMNAIDKTIGEVKDRYLRWTQELASRANDAWDSQEATTLAKIARARQGKRAPSAPSAP